MTTRLGQVALGRSFEKVVLLIPLVHAIYALAVIVFLLVWNVIYALNVVVLLVVCSVMADTLYACTDFVNEDDILENMYAKFV